MYDITRPICFEIKKEENNEGKFVAINIDTGLPLHIDAFTVIRGQDEQEVREMVRLRFFHSNELDKDPAIKARVFFANSSDS